jgi:hypothetical protein
MTSVSFQDIGLRPAQVRAVEKRAKQEGKSPSEYLRFLVERDLLADGSFDEILRPIRAGFKKSGITEDELDVLVRRARKEIHVRPKRKVRK